MAVESTSTTSSGQGSASTLLSDEGQDSDPDTVLRKRQDDDVSVAVDCSKTNDDDSSNATTEILNIQQSLQKVATQLATSVDFFREHAPDIGKLRTFTYTRLPGYCNWIRDVDGKSSSGKSHNKSSASAAQQRLFRQRKRLVRDVAHFPLIPKKGKLQVPMALFCEAEDYPQRTLAIVNYWRQLNACRQRELKAAMQRFYVRPNVTNERLNLNLRSNLNSNLVSVLASSQAPTTTTTLISSSVSPTGVPTPSWGFRCLETCTQLAEKLGLCPPNGGNKLHACDLLRTANLEVPRVNCKVEDCVYPAMSRNHGYCCRHGLHFGPTPGKVNGRRGYLLLGDVYTRPYLATTRMTASSNHTNANPSTIGGDNSNHSTTATTIKKLSTCSCRNETCVGIGYSPTMIQFDIHRLPKDLRDAIWNNSETLNMTARTHFQTSRTTTNESNVSSTNDPSTRLSVLRLAPWHFHPQHRDFLPDGSWKLVDHPFRPILNLASSEEADSSIPNTMSKEWKGLPLPTYSPKDFLNEPIMKEYSARKSIVSSTTDMLPSWCRDYSKREEGPFSIAEVQRNALWERTIELEEDLASRILSFRSKERALKSNLEKLQNKYDEKKFLKRRDKKRKRKSSNSNSSKTSTVGGSKTLSPGTLQEINKSRSPKKKRSESMDKTVDGRKINDTSESTNVSDSERHDPSSSAPIEEVTHRRDSHRMGPVHYTNHPQQPQPQHHHNHRHHPYPHSYPHHPQHHLQHRHPHLNRAAAMDHLRHQSPPPHYHHHPQQQLPLPQQQPQPAEGPYPQHHEAYHPRHDEQEDQYREHSQEPPHHQDQLQQHPQHHPHPQQQQQQQEQEQQRPRHYSEQQDWQRGYYG